jgi:hypothetical protein
MAAPHLSRYNTRTPGLPGSIEQEQLARASVFLLAAARDALAEEQTIGSSSEEFAETASYATDSSSSMSVDVQ